MSNQQNKNHRAFILFIILLITIPLSISGDQTESQDISFTWAFFYKTPGDTANVIVARQGLDLKITWSTANGVVEYEVLRRYGADGQFTTRTVTAGTGYLDTDFDGSKQIQYAVKSINDGIPSQSTRSNIISNYVQNITAELFKSTDSIPLSWDIP